MKTAIMSEECEKYPQKRSKKSRDIRIFFQKQVSFYDKDKINSLLAVLLNTAKDFKLMN